MYKVQKKDGSIEDFDATKILAGVQKAGGAPEEAQKVLADVEAWLPTVGASGVVNSTDIRAKVLALLGVVNPTAAGSFQTYQKPAQPEPTVPMPPAEPVVPVQPPVPPTETPQMPQA